MIEVKGFKSPTISSSTHRNGFSKGASLGEEASTHPLQLGTVEVIGGDVGADQLMTKRV